MTSWTPASLAICRTQPPPDCSPGGTADTAAVSGSGGHQGPRPTSRWSCAPGPRTPGPWSASIPTRSLRRSSATDRPPLISPCCRSTTSARGDPLPGFEQARSLTHPAMTYLRGRYGTAGNRAASSVLLGPPQRMTRDAPARPREAGTWTVWRTATAEASSSAAVGLLLVQDGRRGDHGADTNPAQTCVDTVACDSSLPGHRVRSES